MNQQIIFASLNQMLVLPIKIDIRTNEYKQSEAFGLVAKIKQINEENQYILFNETDLSVIGLTQLMHETFFPNCSNLQKIDLKSIFPFLIGTSDKAKNEESKVQNNETPGDTANIKKQFHVNMTEDMEYILKQQLKNKLQIKNIFSFIVIQHSDAINNPLNSSFRSIRRLNKAKSYKGIQSYNFNYVELFIRKIKYQGVNNVSYVEIVKLRELNPVTQAPIILKEIANINKFHLYSQLFEHPSQLQNIIQELEQNPTINSYLQFNSFHTQFQQSVRNLTSQRETPIDFTSADFQKAQQLLLKQPTLGDESTNLDQIRMMSNRIENEDLNYQTDESSKQTVNQLREQKALSKYSEKLQLNQLYQLQNNIAQDQTFIQSMQENQISNSELQIKIDTPNKNQNLQENQFNLNALPIPQKSDRIINIELLSPHNSQWMNINSYQQSLAQLSDQNFNNKQIKSLEYVSNKAKENIYLDIESSKGDVNKLQTIALTPLKVSQHNSKMFKSKSFRKNKINHNLANVLNNKEKKQIARISYQDVHAHQLYKDKNSKKQKVQDIIYDIASSNSQNSYFTPVKSKLYQIMADESTLKVIKVIKAIGIICYTVMICITWHQFNSMQEYLQEANQDYKDFGWPTTYSSCLSNILKYKNIQYLINITRQNQTDSNYLQPFYNEVQHKMDDNFSELLKLLLQMEVANSNREVFNKVIENKMNFQFGQLYDPKLLNQIQSDNTDLITLNFTTNLQYSILLNVQVIFRYIQGLGNGRPEYYLIANQLEQISDLNILQEEIQVRQQTQQEYIQDQLQIIIIILVIINTSCVGIIIPLYYYIQKERDAIIYLFTTFPIYKLDDLIKKIQNSYFRTNTNSIYQNQNNQIIVDTIVSLQGVENEKNIRKHSISSITSLPRYNKKLIFACFLIYSLLICYLIVVKVLTTDYLTISTLDLQTISKVYYLRSYLLQNIAMNLNVLVMKAQPNLKPMKPEIYYDYLKSLIKQQEDISNDIQWVIKSQYSNKRFNQDLYDNFFFAAFKTNLCDDYKKYPQFNTNPKRINVDLCAQPQSIFLQQGFQVAYQSFFTQFTEVYNKYQIQDFQEQIRFINLKFKLSNQIQMKFNPDLSYQTEEKLNENIGFFDQSFSLMMTTYQYVIYIPSIVSSLNNLNKNPTSYALLSVAVLLNIIISDTDYNYEIKLKDYLAKPFSLLNFSFQSIIEIFILATVLLIHEGESTVLSFYFLLNGLSSYFFAYYFEEMSQLLNLFTHIALLCMSITLQICISYNISNQMLSFLFIIQIPFSYKLACIIVERDHQNLLNDFQLLYEQKQNNHKNIDRIIRLKIFDNIENNSKENEKRYLKFLNLIFNSNKSKQTKQMNFKQDSDNFKQTFQNKELFLEINIPEQQNSLQVQSSNQQFVLFNDIQQLKLIQKKIVKILSDSFMKTSNNKLRNKQNGTQSLLNLFIFLIEISQSYRIYFLKFFQITKDNKLSIKKQQLFNSIHQIFLKKRAVLRKRMGRANPFDCSYLQVIIFENKLEISYSLLRFAINLKLQILSMMKQKDIIVTELISKIESMQKLIQKLKTNLNYLIQLNDNSSDLLNLQALFLENVCFSEKDINLVQENKYARKHSKFHSPLKEDDILSRIVNNDKFDEKTCVIFVSYQDSKKMQIRQVSSNFFNLFYLTNKENIQGRGIECLIPLAFQTEHQIYIKQYLQEAITGNIHSDDLESQNRGINQILDNQIQQQMFSAQSLDFQFEQSEKLSKKENREEILMYQSISSKMNRQIIFASLNQMFILPVRVDIRMNEFKESKAFGLVAKLKQINEEYQYILFNETDLSVIGLTEQLHEIFFPNCENLFKINLRQIFPFLISTQNSIKTNLNIEAANNSINAKKKLHVNIGNDIEDFLKDQIKNQFNKKNKLAFIVIQNSDMTNVTLASSYKCRKNKQSVKKLKKMKSTREITSYCFTYVELALKKLNYKGINNISYIEIVKIRQLNPILQAPIILSEITNIKKQTIYSQLFSFPDEFQNLVTYLEQYTIKHNPINSYDSQLNFSSRDQNQQQLTKEISYADEQIIIIKTQQQLSKPQTFGDESTNLELFKILKNKQDNEDLNCQDFECCNKQFNQQLIEQSQISNNKNQKYCGKLQNNFNLSQQYSMQNINTQDQKFIQSLQDIQQMDFEESEDDLNRANFSFKNISMHKIQEDQQHFTNNFTLLSPCKSDKALNLELMSPADSSFVNIFPNQQSNQNISNQDLEFKSYKTKEIFQKDLDNIKNKSIHTFNKSSKHLKKIKEKDKNLRSCNNNRSPCRLASALSQQHHHQLKNQLDFGKQGSNKNLKDKYQKKKQIQDIQYDIASTTSKDSSSASAKRQLYQIMADKSILQVIKAIKMIGIICFAVMISMTLMQFISMGKSIRLANEDFQVFQWPTTYSSSLSDIVKYKNSLYLIQYARQLRFSSFEQRLIFQNRILSELELTLDEVYELLSDMSKADKDKMEFKYKRETKSFYIFGQLYNTTLLSSTPSNSHGLFSFTHDSSLLSSILLGVQLTFRYTHNQGNERPEYYLIQNQLSQISQLKKVQQETLDEQKYMQQYIREQQSILIIVLVIISAVCVAIIIPLYVYIQKERDAIIYLLTTFPTFKLDSLIKKIQNSYINQSIQSIYQNQNDHLLLDSIISLQVLDSDRNIRKQNISSITKLPRFNKSLIIGTLLIYLLLLCYPIIVKILTQDYLNKTTTDLETMMKVYYLRSYLLQNIAMHYNILSMKVNPRLKPMQPEIYYDYLKTLIEEQEDINNSIQWITKSQYQDQRFNQEEYDDFFFSTFKSNLCETFNFPQFNTNPKNINVDLCNSPEQMLLLQGFKVAYKSLFNLFTDLFNIYKIENNRAPPKQQNFSQILE
ncbi:hypothetical protein ABPG72_016346 [Tetrahymena utriculariae]